jgi:hypothetical protein
VGISKIKGAGRGLFAIRSLPNGTYITSYPGPVVDINSISSRTRAAMRYRKKVHEYLLEVTSTEKVLNFQPDPNDLTKGVAHLANDAIHPEVTGFSNNCDFIQDEKDHIYLCTTRKVRKGEELLVDYLLPYWTSCKKPPKPMSKWLGRVRKVQSTLNTIDVRLEQYMGDNVFEISDPCRRVLCTGCDYSKKRRVRNCDPNNISVSMLKCVTCNANIMYL